MSDTANLWDEDSYYFGVGAHYINECGDADMAIDDTLDANRLRWVEGKGYVRWTPHKLNQLARHYFLTPKDRQLIDLTTEAFWGCTMKDAITLIGKGEADDTPTT
jgi:hypothetical protein